MTATSDRLSLGVSLYGHSATDTIELAAAADGLGYSTVWLGEHVLVPMHTASAHHPYREDERPIVGPDTPLIDLFTTIGAIAVRTWGLAIATGVHLLPLRSPILTALACATAQQISAGRIILGVGSGWLREEYDALGVAFEHRGALLDEHIDVVRAALSGGRFEHHGPYLDLHPMLVTVASAAVPIIIGGTSAAALARAAARGDGWYNPSTTSLDDCRVLRDRIEALRAEMSTDERAFSYYIRMVGDVDQSLIDRYRSAGFTELCVSGHDLWPRHLDLPLHEKLERLNVLAERCRLVGERPQP